MARETTDAPISTEDYGQADYATDFGYDPAGPTAPTRSWIERAGDFDIELRRWPFDLDAPIVDVGGSADGVQNLAATPSLKGVAQFNYQLLEKLRTSVQFRWRGGVTQNGNPTLIFVDNEVDPAWYADFNLNYRLTVGGGDMDVYLNIRNILNTPPEIWASTGGTGQLGTFGGWLQGDDPLGRYYKVGLSYKF